MVMLEYNKVNFYAKIEYFNMTGSIKDRPAYYIIKNVIIEKKINQKTTIIESTSGNFGFSLAVICKKLGLKFIPVIDEMITKSKEQALKLLSYDVIKVTARDSSGGYLLNRIKKVEEYIATHNNVYNPNQYQNKNNYLSYYTTLGAEICKSLPNLDFVFICASSGGTVTGISKKLKEHYNNVKVYAIDVEGSLIFQNRPKKRNISGIGSSIKPEHVSKAYIDEVLVLNESDIIEGCNDLVNEQMLFCGGSSGAAYFGAKSVLKNLKKNVDALIICPDRGDAYLDTIYNEDWVMKIKQNKTKANEIP